MSFPAKFHGRCAGCGEGWEPGDIIMYVDDDLVHEDCATVSRVEDKPFVVCQDCWIAPCVC